MYLSGQPRFNCEKPESLNNEQRPGSSFHDPWIPSIPTTMILLTRPVLTTKNPLRCSQTLLLIGTVRKTDLIFRIRAVLRGRLPPQHYRPNRQLSHPTHLVSLIRGSPCPKPSMNPSFRGSLSTSPSFRGSPTPVQNLYLVLLLCLLRLQVEWYAILTISTKRASRNRT